MFFLADRKKWLMFLSWVTLAPESKFFFLELGLLKKQIDSWKKQIDFEKSKLIWKKVKHLFFNVLMVFAFL